MKARVYISVFILTALSFAAGCAKKPAASNASDSSKSKYSIVCTTFPQYDWVKNVIRGNESKFDLTLLLDKGTDLHNFQPSAKDIIKVSAADLFIYVGGESDEWVEDALKEAVNKKMIALNLVELLGDGAKEEEIVEGMEGDEDEEDESEEEGPEIDEHVWLSFDNAILYTTEISKALCQLDASDADLYSKNAESYKASLAALKGEFGSLCNSSKRKIVLFGDRFPFRYLVDEFDLTYFAAFVGCSAETEASFETIVFLSNKVNEYELPVVFTIENADGKIANTIISTSGRNDVKVMEMDSLQSITAKQIQDGANYLDAMRKNLEVLKVALN